MKINPFHKKKAISPMKKIRVYEQALEIIISSKPEDFSYLTVGWIARKLEVSHPYLFRIFWEFSKMSIRHFLFCERMKWGITLLSEEKKTTTVKKVAFLIDYSSVSYFIRLFKNHFGATPGKIKNCTHCRMSHREWIERGRKGRKRGWPRCKHNPHFCFPNEFKINKPEFGRK
jgi:AraC-like DNA-binding protein